MIIVEKHKSMIKRYLQKKWQLSPEDSDILSKDFALLLSFLGNEIAKYQQLARKKGISSSTMFYSLNACYKCAQAEEEGKPVSTGILIADTTIADAYFPEKLEITVPMFHIKDWIQMRSFCGYVNGTSAAFVVEKSDGTVKSARNLNIENAYVHFTSDVKESVALLVIKGCKCFRLYSEGVIAHQIILIRKHGIWKSRDLISYLERLKPLILKKDINLLTASIAFKVSLLISERSLGAALLIANRIEVLNKIREETQLIPPKMITELTEDQLIRDVTQDGATIMDKSGKIVSVGAKFIVTGGRLASMKDITSSISSSIGVVTSQDGIVSIVENGQVIEEI